VDLVAYLAVAHSLKVLFPALSQVPVQRHSVHRSSLLWEEAQKITLLAGSFQEEMPQEYLFFAD
jgi:hypothetical protein